MFWQGHCEERASMSFLPQSLLLLAWIASCASVLISTAALQISAQPTSKLLHRQPYPDKELPKQRIHSADFIKPHLVDQLLENHRVLGKQVHAPFPVVHPNRPGDDLLHHVAVPPPDQPVQVHHRSEE